MTDTIMKWPDDKKCLESLLSTHVLGNHDDYMKAWHEMNDYVKAEGLFDDEDDNGIMQSPEIKPIITVKPIIWATGNDDGNAFNDAITINDLTNIETRVMKSKEARKSRTKTKAEVFTPSWVCSYQNDLADDRILGQEHVFGHVDGTSWIPNMKPVPFNDDNERIRFILSKRMEITCGEAPYVAQRYDTTSGEIIPVYDENNGFMRSGLLDRKLRVISENKEWLKPEIWRMLAMIALKATYAYEWQGDNLLIARMNIVNDIIEWHEELFKKKPSITYARELYSVVSWNTWQMDGLKQVIPMSCSNDCKACKNKDNRGHDGLQPLIAWWKPSSDSLEPSFDEIRTFDNIVEYNAVRNDK